MLVWIKSATYLAVLTFIFLIGRRFWDGFTVTVRVDPEIALVGQGVILSCHITGQLPTNYQVRWYRSERNKNTTLYFYNNLSNGTEMVRAGDHSMSDALRGWYENGVVTVRLFPVQKEDTGKYVCEVTGDGVYKEADTQVIVADKRKWNGDKSQQKEDKRQQKMGFFCLLLYVYVIIERIFGKSKSFLFCLLFFIPVIAENFFGESKYFLLPIIPLTTEYVFGISQISVLPCLFVLMVVTIKLSFDKCKNQFQNAIDKGQREEEKLHNMNVLCWRKITLVRNGVAELRNKLDTERKRGHAEPEQHEEEMAELRNKLDTERKRGHAESENLQRRMEQVEEEMGVLRNILDTERTIGRAEPENLQRRMEQHEEEIENLQRRMAELRNVLDIERKRGHAEPERKGDHSPEVSEIAEKRIKDLEDKMEKLQEEMDTERKRSHAEPENLQKRIEQLDEEIAHLRNQLDTERKRGHAETENLQRRMENLQRRMEQLEEEIDREMKRRHAEPERKGDHSPAVSEIAEKRIKDLEDKMEKLQEDMEWKRLRKNSADITLDADTAHPNLSIAADEKSFTLEAQPQSVPPKPERFDATVCVLGSQGFSSGKHYWEVDVGSSTDWDLGVAKKSIERKGKLSLSPKEGFWVLGLSGRDYWAKTDPWTRVNVQKKPKKTGIYLNYQEGQVTFYNVTDMSVLFTFSDCSFSGEVCPFFKNSHKGTTMKI